MLKLIDKKSMKFKLWTYFILFATTIIIILWLLQIVFLNSFYETMKKNEIRKIGNSLVLHYGEDGFEDLLYKTSLNEGVGIRILDENGTLVYPINIFDIIRPQRLEYKAFDEFLYNLFSSNENYAIYTRNDVRLEKPILIYGAVLRGSSNTNYYLYIDSVLQPVDSTATVLKNQLIIITFLSFLMSLGLSLGIASRLSKPIEDITKSARKLADGNYNIEFKKGDYTEIDNLADTLNYTTTELSKIEELRRDLIANVSHDLRTPLTLIKSYGELIRDISGNDERKRNYHLKTIIDESDRLSLMVNDMLDLSKVQSGLDNLDISDFDLKDMTEDILKRFNYFKDNMGFSFDMRVSGKSIVSGDKAKIEQVIYNLISNAVNYSKDIKEININITEENGKVLYEVIDKGQGIPQEEIGNIWDRYYKVGKSHIRAASGTGIGLSIVKSILIAHDSEYGVESREGEGSRFYFTLRSI